MGIKAYYNEFDPKAAAWLRQLIKDKLITDGEVDDRSIEDVTAADVVGFDRVHWFAGIGTWDYCLNQSGWGDRNVWTASLPCQPFSSAGKQLGKKDERHLLPLFLELVSECRPDVIIGEQVASAIRHGWLDDLYGEMERKDYAVGSCVFTAAGVGQAHIRQRLYWVADSLSNNNRNEVRRVDGEANSTPVINRAHVIESGEPSGTDGDVFGGVGESNRARSLERRVVAETARHGNTLISTSSDGGVGDTESIRRGIFHTKNEWETDGEVNPFADAGDSSNEQSQGMRSSDIDWLYCRDNKYRPIKSGIKSLVDGAAEKLVRSCNPGGPIDADHTQEARVMRLKGYGNGIVVPCATAFISAYMDVSGA